MTVIDGVAHGCSRTNSTMSPTKQAKQAGKIAARKDRRYAKNIQKGIPRKEPKTNKQERSRSAFTRLERISLTKDINTK